MFAYIVRRLLWAVLLLIVLSMVTFSIFYLIPLLGGATPETLATRYVGRAATAETVHLTAERLGFFDPVPVQYWNWLKGVLVGAEYDYGAGVEHCPAPCLGYSFITKQPVWPELLNRAPVTISLTIGAAIIWLVAGVSIGVISALRRGTGFDRGAMGIAGRGITTDLLHRTDRAGILQLPARDHCTRRHLRSVQ
jgi:peptide/nickel transport system permease protein